MKESTGIAIVLIVVALLAVLVVYRLVSQRRQLSSGREMGRFAPRRHDGTFLFESELQVSRGGEWCRLLLTLKSAEASRMRYSPASLFEKVALLIGTPYTLVLKDGYGRVVHSESGSLEPFVRWLASRQQGVETPFGESGTGSHHGTVTLLEFLPKAAGRFALSLEIAEKVEAEYPGSSSIWQVMEAELIAREGVIPLSRTVSYPHRRVRL